MVKEMVNGSNGMIMDKLKFKENTTEARNMVNDHCGTIMAKQKNKEHLALEKLIVYTNNG